MPRAADDKDCNFHSRFLDQAALKTLRVPADPLREHSSPLRSLLEEKL